MPEPHAPKIDAINRERQAPLRNAMVDGLNRCHTIASQPFQYGQMPNSLILHQFQKVRIVKRLRIVLSPFNPAGIVLQYKEREI